MQSNIISNIIRPIYSVCKDMPIYIGTNNINSIFFKSLQLHLSDHILDMSLSENMVPYDLYLSDSPEYATHYLQTNTGNHLHTVVYIHNNPTVNIKKEDKYLIKQRLGSAHIVFRNSLIQNQWFDTHNNQSFIDYGLPPCDISEPNEKKSIILINYQKNNNLTLLSHNLKQSFPDLMVLDDINSLDYNQICNILQQYKLCITSGDYYNVLCAASNGCKVISTETLPGVNSVEITTFDQLFRILPMELSQYSNNIDNCLELKKLYNFDNFTTNFRLMCRDILRKPVLL